MTVGYYRLPSWAYSLEHQNTTLQRPRQSCARPASTLGILVYTYTYTLYRIHTPYIRAPLRPTPCTARATCWLIILWRIFRLRWGVYSKILLVEHLSITIFIILFSYPSKRCYYKSWHSVLSLFDNPQLQCLPLAILYVTPAGLRLLRILALVKHT